MKYIAALDHPEKITAVLPLCGWVNDSDTSRICVLKNIPILTYHETADKDISIEETEKDSKWSKKIRGGYYLSSTRS